MEVLKMTRSKAKIIGESYNSDSSSTSDSKVERRTRRNLRGSPVKSDNSDDSHSPVRVSTASSASTNKNDRKSDEVQEEMEEEEPKLRSSKRIAKVQEEGKGDDRVAVVVVEKLKNSDREKSTKEDNISSKSKPSKESETTNSTSKTPPQIVPLSNGNVEDKVDKKEEHKMQTEEQTETNIDNAQAQFVKCTCSCEDKLKKLEVEVQRSHEELENLKTWKESRKDFDDIISGWKDEVDKWMRSKFGFTVSVSGTGTIGNGEMDEKRQSSKKLSGSTSKNEVITVPSTSKVLTQEFFDEGDEADNSSLNSQSPTKKSGSVVVRVTEMPPEPVLLNSKEVENVEITPEVFGHFLLEDDPADDWNPDQQDYNSDDYNDTMDVDDDNDDTTTQFDNIRTEVIKQFMDGDADDDDDSDDSVHYVSDDESSSDDFDSSGDEEFKRRTRQSAPKPMKSKLDKGKPGTSSNSKTRADAPPPPPIQARKPSLDAETKRELMKLCKARPGNLFECTVCGFLLPSFENMLLHIKYNHSTSAHTCPFCRIVILCRSPKDAMMHQSVCKMRPPGSKGLTPKYSFQPVNHNTPSTSSASYSYQVPSTSAAKGRVPVPVPSRPLPSKRRKPEDVHAEVNKFVDELLGPGPLAKYANTTAKHLSKAKRKSETEVVTLSSDEGDSSD